MKCLLLAIIFTAQAFSKTEFSLQVTKSSFLFIKWANFAPSVSIGGKVGVSLNTVSKWYIIAQYYEKIASGNLKVALFFHTPGSETFQTFKLIPKKFGDHIELEPEGDLNLDCVENAKFDALIERVDLKDDTFSVNVSFNCHKEDYLKLFGVEGYKNDEVPKLNSQLQPTPSNALLQQQPTPNNALMQEQPTPNKFLMQQQKEGDKAAKRIVIDENAFLKLPPRQMLDSKDALAASFWGYKKENNQFLNLPVQEMRNSREAVANRFEGRQEADNQFLNVPIINERPSLLMAQNERMHPDQNQLLSGSAKKLFKD